MLYNPNSSVPCSKCGKDVERFKGCENCATLEKLKGKVCPCCKGEDIRLDQTREGNGIIGSGYSSWVVSEVFVCNDCGVLFKNGKSKG